MKDLEYIYFMRPIGMNGPVKIGRSIRPDCRLAAVDSHSPLRMEIAALCLGGQALEIKIQGHFFDLHSHSEWFFGEARLCEAIEKIARGYPPEVAIDLEDQRGNIRSRASRIRRGMRCPQYYQRMTDPTLLALSAERHQYI